MRNKVCSAMLLFCLQSICAVQTCFADELQDALGAAGSRLGSLKDLGNLGNTAESLEQFVAKHPKDAAARYELAKSYMSAKQGEAAEEQLRACMELVPVGSDLHNSCIASLRQISEMKYAGALGRNSVAASQRSIAPQTNTDSRSVSSSAANTTWSRPIGRSSNFTRTVVPAVVPAAKKTNNVVPAARQK